MGESWESRSYPARNPIEDAMKPGLQRIEATLKQMIEQPVSMSDSSAIPSAPISFTLSPTPVKPSADPIAAPPATSSTIDLPPTPPRLTHSPATPEQPRGDRPVPSPFLSVTGATPSSPVHTPPPESTDAPPPPAAGIPSFKVAVRPSPHSAPVEKPVAIPGEAVRPFTVQDNLVKGLGLPRFKLPNFSTSRYVTNPDFVVGLLNELTSIVSQWQKELQQVALKIQDLYLEGPVIDGWLESQTAESPPPTPGIATIRHAEIEQLMEYVEEICKGAPSSAAHPPRTGYRLCGLDADGQLWSRPCASEKVPEVSLAIARYQKLRQLLAQKTQLEGRLDQFAKALIDLHSSIPND